MLYVNKNILHVDINESHVNKIMLHVDLMYLANMSPQTKVYWIVFFYCTGNRASGRIDSMLGKAPTIEA